MGYHCAKVLQVDLKRQVLKVQYMKVDDEDGWVPEGEDTPIHRLVDANPNGATIRACNEKAEKLKAEERAQWKENQAKSKACIASGFSNKYTVIIQQTTKNSIKIKDTKCYCTLAQAKDACCRKASCKSLISKSTSSPKTEKADDGTIICEKRENCWSEDDVPQTSENDGSKVQGAWLVYTRG